MNNKVDKINESVYYKLILSSYLQQIMQDFNNKVAVITGGASGIGLALAKRLGKEGAKIVIGALRPDRLEGALAQLQELNLEAVGQICDVRKEADLIALEQFARSTFGSLEVLVNNAGVGGTPNTVFDMSAVQVQEVLEVNFYAVWNAIRIFGKKMIEAGRPCAIYNVGSENSFFHAVRKAPAYIMSKYAVHALTRSLQEDAPSFMQVGLIIPGFVFTEIGPKQFMQLGMSVDEFVDRLIPQMKAGAFYIVSHAYNAVRVDEVYQQISRAYEQYAPRYEGDEKYDVQLLMEKIRNKS